MTLTGNTSLLMTSCTTRLLFSHIYTKYSTRYSKWKQNTVIISNINLNFKRNKLNWWCYSRPEKSKQGLRRVFYLQCVASSADDSVFYSCSQSVCYCQLALTDKGCCQIMSSGTHTPVHMHAQNMHTNMENMSPTMFWWFKS